MLLLHNPRFLYESCPECDQERAKTRHYPIRLSLANRHDRGNRHNQNSMNVLEQRAIAAIAVVVVVVVEDVV